jgi:hypothetical protein
MNSFENYMEDLQGFRSRRDRLRDYFDERRIDIVINFMQSAYEQGRKDAGYDSDDE